MNANTVVVMLLLVTLAGLFTVATVTGPVTAENNGNETATESPLDDCEDPERVDAITVICSAEDRDGVAHVEIYSHANQTVTLTDGSWLMQGGEPESESFELVDGMNSLRMNVDRVDGQSAVALETDRTPAYGIPLRTRSTLVGGPYEYRDLHATGLGVLLGSTVGATWAAWRRYRGRLQQPRRIA